LLGKFIKGIKLKKWVQIKLKQIIDFGELSKSSFR